MKITITSNWRVDAQKRIRIGAPAISVWGQMRDVPWFLTRDPLHARVQRTDGAPANAPWSNAQVLVSHRILGIGPDRVGRVLAWKEGRGYAISDLSRRGITTGFPHICAFQVVPFNEFSCDLVISTRGRWTATFLPRTVVRIWLWWVLAATQARLEADLRTFAHLHASRRS